MRGRGFVLAVVLSAVGLPACRDEAVQTPAAVKGNASTQSDVQQPGGHKIRARIHSSLPEYLFIVRGEQPDATAGFIRVTSIEIQEATASRPLQVIEGLQTETPVVPGEPPLELIDMNFDGYQDMRIVEAHSAGPNTSYLNWRFDSATGKFVESKELNELTSPQFDPVRREIRSDWRDGATRYGTSIYTFTGGRLIPVRKEERTYHSPGVYLLTVSRFADGNWVTVERREVREPTEPDATRRSTTGK